MTERQPTGGPPFLVFRLRPGVSLVELDEQSAALRSPWSNATVSELTPGLYGILRVLSRDGATEDQLFGLAYGEEDVSAGARLYYYLEQLSQLGLLCYLLAEERRPLATVVPMTMGYPLFPSDIDRGARYRLSRFAYCRQSEQGLVLESPLARARVVLLSPECATLVASLVQPRTYPELGTAAGLPDPVLAQAFLRLLAHASMVTEVDRRGVTQEDEAPALSHWEFHDLLFHTRSRIGRHDYPFGGSFPFLGRVPPLPAVKPPASDDAILLYKPDVQELARIDVPFTQVLESRRSIRKYGSTPLTARQLGEFLYRVARVRRVVDADPARGLQYQVSSRPYPSGGAAYDLELYITVGACEGLSAAMYHYDPLGHQLHLVTEWNQKVAALLRHAQACGALDDEPQVLIILASRFQRVSWKYTSMAYALTLKHVGVLYQTMYLVATAMGLAPCGLGGGNSDLFAETAGADYFAETSVGEFLLGSSR